MSIKSIEIICIPCQKCEYVEIKVREAIKTIEMENKIKIPFEFKHTVNLLNTNKYSLKPSQTPIVLVNGSVEFAGKIDPVTIKRRLDSIQKGY